MTVMEPILLAVQGPGTIHGMQTLMRKMTVKPHLHDATCCQTGLTTG